MNIILHRLRINKFVIIELHVKNVVLGSWDNADGVCLYLFGLLYYKPMGTFAVSCHYLRNTVWI